MPDNKLNDFQRSNTQQGSQPNSNKRVKPLPQQRQLQQQQPIFPISAQLRALAANNFQISRQEQEYPSDSYGVPAKNDDDGLPEDPQPTDLPASDDEDEQNQQVPNDGRTVITVSNAFSGQYYVLGPDNNLQRVMFSTSQSDEDRRNMGFTAQLRYSPVEPIRGPVYAYNEQGQLVRIYK